MTAITNLVDITEIAARDVPPVYRPNRGVWHLVAEEVLLRLERTPPSKALRLDFHDAPTARKAKEGLRKAIIRRKGPQYVDLRLRGYTIYVCKVSKHDHNV